MPRSAQVAEMGGWDSRVVRGQLALHGKDPVSGLGAQREKDRETDITVMRICSSHT